MICEKCRQDFPSQYYFKTETVCIECFNKMSESEKQEATRRSLMKHPMTSTTFEIEGHRVVKRGDRDKVRCDRSHGWCDGSVVLRNGRRRGAQELIQRRVS